MKQAWTKNQRDQDTGANIVTRRVSRRRSERTSRRERRKKRKNKNTCSHCKKYGQYRSHPKTLLEKCFWNKRYKGWRP
jgi:hypothetical protein